MKNKYWNEEEIEILGKMWGRSSISNIAKKLDRTENSVKVKGQRLFGSKSEYVGLYTGADLARAIGVDNKMINYYLKKGLQYRKSGRLNLIKIEDFWKFAKEHKDLIKFYKIEKNIIPNEPKWVKEIRNNQNKYNKPNKYKKWTNYQDILLINMVRKGLSTKEIAKELQRTEYAVKSRRKILNLKYILDLENEKVTI